MGYCAGAAGTQVGDGQCWSFVDACLRVVGARPALLQNFGQVIFESDASAGDILSFYMSSFEGTRPDGSAYSQQVCYISVHFKGGANSSSSDMSTALLLNTERQKLRGQHVSETHKVG